MGTPSVETWDFQLFALIGYTNLSTLMMAALIGSSRSKYATLAAARLGALAPIGEIFFIAALLFTVVRCGGVTVQSVGYTRIAHVFGMPFVGYVLLVFTLFEARRAPFDHTEAESELVAGHLVEFGGRTLLVFFVCEYIHVYFCIFYINVFVYGAFESQVVTIPFFAV
jgi:NADH-quinone oxidoreductase subunit H